MLPDHENPFYLTQPKRRAGSGALILDPEGRVLLVEPTYKDTWEIPGGIVETGEDPRAACVRECLEELGMAIRLGRLLVLEHQVEPLPRGDSLMFVYDAGTMADTRDIRLQHSELKRYRFMSLDEIEHVTSERLARRIRQAVRARRHGQFIEMVNGVPVEDTVIRR